MEDINAAITKAGYVPLSQQDAEDDGRELREAKKRILGMPVIRRILPAFILTQKRKNVKSYLPEYRITDKRLPENQIFPLTRKHFCVTIKATRTYWQICLIQ